MTKRRVAKRAKTLSVGSPRVTRITPEEQKDFQRLRKKRLEMCRKKYPEVRGKVVDYITHSIDDGTLYFSIWFKDKTCFSLRYGCDMFVVGADFSDWKTGDDHIIRQYMKPIPR